MKPEKDVMFGLLRELQHYFMYASPYLKLMFHKASPIQMQEVTDTGVVIKPDVMHYQVKRSISIRSNIPLECIKDNLSEQLAWAIVDDMRKAGLIRIEESSNQETLAHGEREITLDAYVPIFRIDDVREY